MTARPRPARMAGGTRAAAPSMRLGLAAFVMATIGTIQPVDAGASLPINTFMNMSTGKISAACHHGMCPWR